MRISDWSSDVCSSDLDQAGARFQIDPHGLCHDQGIRSHASPAQRTGSPLVPAARHQGRGAPCGESFWHWALGADGGHGHAQPPFRSSRLIGAERQPTSDCRQSLQQSPVANEVGLFDPIRGDFSGARLPFSPKWQSSLSADYSLPLGGVNLTMGTTISSQSKSLGVLAITNADKDLYEVHGRTLVSARLGVEDRKSKRLNSS